MAICYAAGGTVQCFCQPGFRGNGVGPMGCVPGSGSDVGPVMPPRDGGGVVMSPCASGPCQVTKVQQLNTHSGKNNFQIDFILERVYFKFLRRN